MKRVAVLLVFIIVGLCILLIPRHLRTEGVYVPSTQSVTGMPTRSPIPSVTPVSTETETIENTQNPEETPQDTQEVQR